MKQAIEKGEFIENAEFAGNLYGTRYVLIDAIKQIINQFNIFIASKQSKMFRAQGKFAYWISICRALDR